MMHQQYLERKPWGRALHVNGMGPVRAGTDQVDVCWINAGMGSSVHRHRRKTNLFIVMSGDLDLRTFGDGGAPRDACDTFRLPVGQIVQIGPDVWHQFVAVTDVQLVEVYLPAFPGEKARLEDIERDLGVTVPV